MAAGCLLSTQSFAANTVPCSGPRHTGEPSRARGTSRPKPATKPHPLASQFDLGASECFANHNPSSVVLMLCTASCDLHLGLPGAASLC